MKKTVYYASHFGRTNVIKEAFLNFTYSFASMSRMPLEVFTRKNFGERYFSFAHVIIFLVLMSIFPVFYIKAQDYAFGGMGAGTVVLKFTTWYLFLAAVLKVSLKRREEVKRLPSVFDFARFTLSTGEINPVLRGVKIKGKTTDIRQFETLVEPGFFLAFGAALAILAQPIGYFIIIASILYSLSYVMAYRMGDNFIMDLIDNMIVSEELAEVFINDKPSDEARGFRTYDRKPSDPDLRRKVADAMVGNEEPTFAV